MSETHFRSGMLVFPNLTQLARAEPRQRDRAERVVRAAAALA